MTISTGICTMIPRLLLDSCMIIRPPRSVFQVELQCVTLALLRPYIICLTRGSNSQPHYDNSHYQLLHSLSYATPRSRSLHSLMAIRLMFTSCQILHHAYRTASHLGASCISSPLYDPYLASCSSHVFLMTRTRPIGYDPLI